MTEFAKAYVTLLPSLDPKKVVGEAQSAGKKAGQLFTKEFESLLPSLDTKKIIAEAKSAGNKAGHFLASEFGGAIGSAGAGAGQDFSRDFAREAEKGAKISAERMTGIFDDSLGIIGGESALKFGEAFTEHIGEFVGEALDHEKLADKTSAALGLSAQQSKKAGAVAGELYAGAWGESMPDVTHAVEAVISSIDGMGKAAPERLHDVTAGVLNLADAFDVDASEGARNVGILIKQGLAKDAEEGVDLITASLQRVPEALRGEVTDATQEYSQFFADVGFSGSQALGLLVSASEDGQFGIDKVGDAIKEFTIRSTDLSATSGSAFKRIGLDMGTMTNDLLAGGDRAQGAFQKIIGGLQGIKDPGKQAEASIALFGTPLEDLGTNEIPKFLKSLGNGVKGMGDVKGAAEKMGDTLADNVGTDIETVKRKAEIFVTEGLGALFAGFKTGKTEGDGFAGAMSAVGAFITNKAVPALKNLGEWLRDNVLPQLKKFGEWLRDNVLPQLKKFGDWLVSPLLPQLKKFGEWLRDNVLPELKKLGEWIRDNVLPQLKNLGAWLRDDVLPQVKKFGDFLADAGEWIGKNKDLLISLGFAVGVFVAAMKTASIIQSVVGFMKLFTAANIAATIEQWKLNAALLANPIVLIVAGIIALVAGLIWFFTQTKTGKKVWKAFTGFLTDAMDNVVGFFQNAWQWIQDAISAVWGWIKKNWPLLLAIITGPIGLAVLFIVKNWDKIKAATKKIWDAIKKAITTVWDAIWGFLKKVWGWIKAQVFDRIALALLILREAFKLGRDKIVGFFTNIWEKMKLVWGYIRDKVLAKFKAGLTLLKEAFGNVRDGIKTIWDKLKKIAAKPVNFIIKWVYNKGIVPLVGAVFSFLKQENPLAPIDPIEFASGGWTGPGRRLAPAGIVHADEFVINKGSRRRLEQQQPGALDFMNNTGRLPGYADGGSVATLSEGAKWWQRLGARVSEFSAWGQPVHRGHVPGSLHYVGRAADLNYGPSGESVIEKTFFDKYLHFFRKEFPDLGVLWRVANHFNHMHIDTGERGSSVGETQGKFNLPDKVAGFTALFDKLKELGETPFGGMLRDMGGRLVGGVIEWVKDRFAGSGEDAHQLEKGGAMVGTVRDAVRAVASTRGWDTGAQWDALAWIINTESGWDPNAANATSSARGLFQKLTSAHGPIESTIKAQTEWGLDYIADRYGTPTAAKRHHLATGWYADGGLVAPKLYDSGGWLPAGGVGVNRTGKPEAVLTPEESNALRAGLNRRPVELHFYGQRTPTVRDVVHALNVADLHDVGVTA